MRLSVVEAAGEVEFDCAQVLRSITQRLCSDASAMTKRREMRAVVNLEPSEVAPLDA